MSHTRFAAEPLGRWAAALLMRHGVAAADATLAARVLLRTSLRGIDTHGISRLPAYAERLHSGDVNATPSIELQWQDGSLHVDGDRGLGQVVAMKAIDALVDRTEDMAVAACTIRASGHLAALGLFALQAAERGRVAWLCQRTPPIMALAGATAPAIGNNPMAFAAPIAGGAPLVFDMAASVVARGHVLQASRDHAGIPEGWALGPDGQPTTDPTAALAGAMLPIAGHKGIGLAMLVECLGGALAGGIPAQSGKTDSRGSAADASAFALVLNPDRFVGREAFDAGMRRWVTHYLDSSGPGCRYPGQRQAHSERQRAMEGIPLPASVVRELSTAGEAVGMAFDVGSQR